MKSNPYKQKRCRACGIYKDKSIFHKSSANKDGLVSYCKPCQNAKGKQWKKDSEVYKAWTKKSRLSLYNVTESEYNKLNASQGGVCAICGLRRLRGRDRYLHMDHDHITGKVRGLLCHVCNTTLGKYEKWKQQIDNYLKEV